MRPDKKSDLGKEVPKIGNTHLNEVTSTSGFSQKKWQKMLSVDKVRHTGSLLFGQNFKFYYLF